MIKCNGKKICSRVKYFHSVFAKAIGLMFHFRSPDTGYVFVFDSMKEPFSISIHNFFVFFPIDVVYLDSSRRVVDVVHSFRPFTPLYVPKKSAQYIIEFPFHVDVKTGDMISF